MLSLEQVNAFLTRHFPQIGPGRDFIVEAVGPMTARLRLVYREEHLRPGGTISGPSMFALADVAIYVAILGEVGVGDDPDNAHMSPGSLTVTTNLNINFLRKPEPRDLIGEAKLMKLGKRLAVGEAWLHSEGSEDAVAHAVATYSIPPR
jgi:acyl-coenzyme A thioesterase PaaI-like protein